MTDVAFADMRFSAKDWPAKVRWSGKQNSLCRPGTTGTVVKVAHHDPSSIKVRWDDRPAALGVCTWEREKNLAVTSPRSVDGESRV